MAGYVVTRDSWTEALQNEYVKGKFWSAVNTATPFYDELEKKETTHGKQRVSLLQVAVAQGSGARGEMEATPDPGAQVWKNPIIDCKYNYAVMRASGPSMVFSTANAFVNFATQLVNGAKEGFKLNLARQTWGDGQGILALVNNGAGYAAGASSVTVDSAYGVLWGSMAARTTMLIKTQMVVQFGTENNNGAGYTVQIVSGTGFTFTPQLQNAVADNATVTLKASANKEIEGWLKMVATAAFQTTLGLSTTYHAIDRATSPEWEGNVLNANNAAVSLDIIRALRDAIFQRTDDELSNLFMSSTEFARDYEKLLQPGVRFQPLELKGGVKALSHDGLIIKKDSRAPAKAFSLADTDVINWVQPEDPNWITDGGDIMMKVQGLDAKEGTYRWYSNLEVREPRRLGLAYGFLIA